MNKSPDPILCGKEMNPVKVAAKIGDKMKVKTLGGGTLSGQRVVVFERDESTLAEDLPLGTLIEFEDDRIHVMGSYISGMGRSPDGWLDTRQATVSEFTDPEDQTQQKVMGLNFVGGQRLLFHYIYPGQVFTVLRIGLQ